MAIPGPAGWAVILAMRFVAYIFAGNKLKRRESAIGFEPKTLAMWLSALGILILPLEVLWLFFLAGGLATHGPFPLPERLELSAILALLYFAFWIIGLWATTRTTRLNKGKFYLYAVAGTVLSLAVDFVGFALSSLLPDGGYLD